MPPQELITSWFALGELSQPMNIIQSIRDKARVIIRTRKELSPITLR